MNYAYIEKCNLTCGEGVRAVLWVSGCPIHCEGCQNEWLQNPDEGLPFDHSAYLDLLNAVEPDYIEGLTFCGGDPLAPYNRETVTDLAREIKERFPDKNIWCYTGYTFEKVKDLDIMSYIDVLVDGPFVKAIADVRYPYAGSTNQRVIDVRETLKQDTIILHGT